MNDPRTTRASDPASTGPTAHAAPEAAPSKEQDHAGAGGSSRWTLPVAGVLLAGLFVGINALAGATLRGARLDATADGLYTLTAGSRAVAASPSEPVTLTLYFSRSLAQGNPALQAHAQRVAELLEEYARVSNGKVLVRRVDPEPFSEAEEEAVAAGVRGIPISADGRSLYFGLVGTNAVDTRQVLPFLDPAQERFLEYDVSRMISVLANPTRPKIGVLSPLPMQGGVQMDPRTGRPVRTRGYAVMEDVRSLFDVVVLDPASAEASIPEGVGVLMVAHPRDLSRAWLYAIDQFVLGGGRLLAFVDPHCESDGGDGAMGMQAGPTASDLRPLLAAWGLEMPLGVVAADRELAQRVLVPGPGGGVKEESYVAWLGVGAEQLDAADVVTGGLSRVNVATAGHLRTLPTPEGAGGAGADGVRPTVTPIMTTTARGGELATTLLRAIPDPASLAEGFVPGNEALTLAARISGPGRSAFGSARPEDLGPTAEGSPAHRVDSSGPINVILVADADMLVDRMWVQASELLPGLPTRTRLADNADFVLAALDNLTGSTDLISVRTRGSAERTFTVVEQMQRRADERLVAERAVLEASLAEAEKRIAELEAGRGPEDRSLTMTPEQQRELENVRAEVVQTRRRLRGVQLELRQDIETLGAQLRAVNIALVPGLVLLGAAGLGWARASRRRRPARGG